MAAARSLDADVPERSFAAMAPASPAGSFEGRVLGGTYRVLGEIGRGAMGVVYEAQHLRLYRRVAIKVLPRQLAARPELRARFEHEADLISRVRSRHVVGILDHDVTEQGEPYLVLELLEGETLAARLTRAPRLSVSECVGVIRQVALGLSAAHRADVVHRDLKPDNVFLVADPDEALFVKLLDFGIGKSLGSGPHITAERMIVGTPDYMSPEQAVGNRHEVDGRTDQHALAVLAYEMLTGVQPFADDDFTEAIRRVITLTPPPASSLRPELSTAVDAVLGRAFSKAPGDRYPHIAEFARALETAADLPPASSPLPSRAAGELALAHEASAVGSLEAAATHAGAAYDLLSPHGIDAATARALARMFVLHLGPPSTRLTRVSAVGEWRRQVMSPRTAFLLSRLECGMSIATALDVAAMSRLEALRRLVTLVSRGDLRVEASGASATAP